MSAISRGRPGRLQGDLVVEEGVGGFEAGLSPADKGRVQHAVGCGRVQTGGGWAAESGHLADCRTVMTSKMEEGTRHLRTAGVAAALACRHLGLDA